MIYDKDPEARLDYTWDWTAWLETGETITAHTVAVTKGDVTLDGDTEAAGVVTAWVTGGTAATIAWVTCHITTSDDREDERTLHLSIRDR